MTDEESADVDPHEWVLVHDKSAYFRGPNGYRGPFGFASASAAALTHLSPSPVSLYKFTKDGAPRLKTVIEMAEASGRVIDGVAIDLNGQVPRYDRYSNTLFEAPCPLRTFEPVFDAEVDGWLRAMAGSQIENLTRWLFWVTRLDRPCAALYLLGAPDTGKSLLATELAKLWSQSGITTLETAIADFNDAILQCPLIFGDEFVPRDKGDEIKRFVSERDRPCKRKFLPVARMVGSTRLILAANNLRFADIFGDMTEDDIQAFLDRFVGIDVSVNAIEYLKTHDVAAWVREDRIPKYVMWLRENLDFAPVGRFLVRGSGEGKLRMALSTRTGTRALVCEWLAGFLRNPKQGLIKSQGGLTIGNGQLRVTTAAVSDCWDLYSPGTPRPRIGQLNLAIGALSHREWVDGRRYRVIDAKTLGQWLEEHDLMSVEGLRMTLDRPTEKA